jgi:hypothetical protein
MRVAIAQVRRTNIGEKYTERDTGDDTMVCVCVCVKRRGKKRSRLSIVHDWN